MGAQTFGAFQPGDDVQTAFEMARDAARYEHGDSRYTGTILDKSRCVIAVNGEYSLVAAKRIADQGVTAEPFNDTDGPAGAIRVYDTRRSSGPDSPTIQIVGWYFFGWARR